jgi:azurin
VAAAAPAAAEESAPAPAAEAPTDAPAGEAPKTAAAEKPAKPAAAPASGEVSEVLLKPDPANPLAYDVKAFSVKANSTVKLTFENIHPTVPQPHNVVIGVPGSKDKILAAAMQLAADPQGMAKGYIPESEDVLFHTKLLQPGQTEVLEFAAPAAGQYPYVCTFPGHGILMNGIMTVE